MAIEKRFREMLDQNVRDINAHYQSKLNEIFSSIKEKLEEKSNFKGLVEQKAQLKKEIEEKQNQIREIETQIRQSKDYKDREFVEESVKDVKSKGNLSTESYYEYSAQEIEALKLVSETPEYANYVNFSAIAKNVKNTFNLCATNKEARNVLITFQNKNWRAIGVDLPALQVQGDFKIDDSGNVTCKALPPVK